MGKRIDKDYLNEQRKEILKLTKTTPAPAPAAPTPALTITAGGTLSLR